MTPPNADTQPDAEPEHAPDPAAVLAERLRAATAQRRAATAMSGPSDRDREELDELTAMNNQLAGLQRELASSNAKLQELSDWKTRFLAMVAHDLRGPLTAVRGFAEMLELFLPEGLDDAREMAGHIVGSSDQLRRMIDDLLDASQLEAGKFQLRLQLQVDIAAVIEEALKMQRPPADAKSITIVADVSDGLELGFGDRDRLVQVVANLVSNAVKYSHSNTTVRVAALGVDDRVVITVTDEGQGMAPEDLAKLFSDYGTTSVKSTAGERSTGLGLTIVQAIVAGHGGTIHVTSEVGVGTTFRVELPADGPTGDSHSAP